MKKIPKFKSEAEERAFWAKADSTDYIDWSKGKRVIFPNLKPSLKTISLRLPKTMLDELKLQANKRDVPYQSLIKVYLAEKLEESRTLARRDESPRGKQKSAEAVGKPTKAEQKKKRVAA